MPPPGLHWYLQTCGMYIHTYAYIKLKINPKKNQADSTLVLSMTHTGYASINAPCFISTVLTVAVPWWTSLARISSESAINPFVYSPRSGISTPYIILVLSVWGHTILFSTVMTTILCSCHGVQGCCLHTPLSCYFILEWQSRVEAGVWCFDFHVLHE